MSDTKFDDINNDTKFIYRKLFALCIINSNVPKSRLSMHYKSIKN